MQNYREWNSQSLKFSKNKNILNAVETTDGDQQHLKNERSESGFDESINDGIFNNNNNQNCIHIPLDIPLPPTRVPPPIEADFTPQPTPIPYRKFQKQPISNINFIDATPSPILEGKRTDWNNNEKNISLIENVGNNHSESEIKIDELNVNLVKSNVRKEGIISEKIKHEELEDFEIKVYPKDRW
jgi:hypothetical protein